MKPLDLKQRAFKADEITYLDRKSIQLDRMLLNLFELLRFDGRPAVHRRPRRIDLDSLLKLMQARPSTFPGFTDHPETARAWLSGGLIEIMNRDKPGREMVVGPRPLHLNAFKLANPKAAADYGASRQVWAMLFHADHALLGRLKAFFGRGLDPAADVYDRSTPLDIETLAILGLVDQVTVDPQTTPLPDPLPPLCLGQGRILADDLRRLLAHEQVVPRHVLAGYIQTVIGLHLALFTLRLFWLLPDWIEGARRHESCSDCPLECGNTLDLLQCPYQHEIVVDMTDDPASPATALARESASMHLDRVSAYTRAVILLNRLKEFASVLTASGRRPPARSVSDLLPLLAEPLQDMEGHFLARIADVISQGPDEEEDSLVKAILRVDGLTSLERYVELACLQRMKNERNALVKMFDSLAQKNRPGGFLRQRAGPRSPRWFALGGDLLETLVQIAVVTRDGDGFIRSHNMLIDDFIEWLRTRYGFVVYAPAYRDVPPEERGAWRTNERGLRDRLRQIGFFTDLSDAYNSQTLRPRYQVSTHD
ncbi:MAG: methylation-associated defense system protein MAD7 [Dehalococcoidia bacterium]